MTNDPFALVRKGLDALENDNTMMALMHFEEASALQRTPTILSCMGYCMAREKRDTQRAVALCREAIRQEPGNTLHHYNLGRIYLLTGQKRLALTTFRKGLKFGRHQGIIDELKDLGLRRRPVFSALGRQHPVNKYCGILFARLGLR